MATVSKDRMREVLQQSMEDVAMAMADSVSYQQRLIEIRAACRELWQMADLGADLPEYEVQVKARNVG